jgi:hypothetical protein
MHIVSWNIEKYKSYVEASQSPDGLVVLGILFNVSFFDNPVMEGIVQAIPRIRDPGTCFDSRSDNICKKSHMGVTFFLFG